MAHDGCHSQSTACDPWTLPNLRWTWTCWTSGVTPDDHVFTCCAVTENTERTKQLRSLINIYVIIWAFTVTDEVIRLILSQCLSEGRFSSSLTRLLSTLRNHTFKTDPDLHACLNCWLDMMNKAVLLASWTADSLRNTHVGVCLHPEAASDVRAEGGSQHAT